MSIEVMNHPMPRIIFESGWSESFNELLEDVRQWLVGANGAVQAVILIKWTKSSTTPAVRGLVELWVLGRDGMPCLQQTEVCPLWCYSNSGNWLTGVGIWIANLPKAIRYSATDNSSNATCDFGIKHGPQA